MEAVCGTKPIVVGVGACVGSGSVLGTKLCDALLQFVLTREGVTCKVLEKGLHAFT